MAKSQYGSKVFSFPFFIDEEQKKAYPVSNIAGKLLAYPALLLQ